MHESALRDVIARADIYTLTDGGSAPSFVLPIARPIITDVDWQCNHRITGLPGEEHVLSAYGTDSFQALYVFHRTARARMLNVERELGTWLFDWDSGDIRSP